MATETLILLGAGFFTIALMYSSVGFGGGSSYLALLSLALSEFYMVRSLALLCNIAVVGGSTWQYLRNGSLEIRNALPLVLASVPMAYFGAIFRLSQAAFFALLGMALILSSIALAWQSLTDKSYRLTARSFPKWVNVVLGGSIGFFSGLVGIGGGIFLSPILNYLRWDHALKIAAVSSFFILVNSVSGLAGLLSEGTFVVDWKTAAVLIGAVIAGGQIGVRLSVKRLSGKTIKLLTSLLVLIVGLRLLLVYLPQL